MSEQAVIILGVVFFNLSGTKGDRMSCKGVPRSKFNKSSPLSHMNPRPTRLPDSEVGYVGLLNALRNTHTHSHTHM